MKIILKKKELKNGRYSLYIEYYKGSTTTEEGKKKHLREFEYLKLYPHQKPKTPIEKKESKEAEDLAEQILAIRKSEFFQGKYNLKNDRKEKILFLDYFNQKKEERYESKGNYDNWNAAYLHLERYCPKNKTMGEVDETFIKGFKSYLDREAQTKSNTSLSQNSKYTYFNKFKACLRTAYEEGYFPHSPLREIKSFDQAESQREYLTFSEVKSLNKTECKYEVLKRAFLFSCLSGLRWSDINTLVWSEVRDEDGISKVNYRQEKTDGVEYLYISHEARTLLGERKEPSERVFIGLKYGQQYNTEILRWCMRAGITKHITFHSARHTNAVLLLENGADIYTVSKRLGHRELRTTEIYAKIIDTKMKEAAFLIPEINL